MKTLKVLASYLEAKHVPFLFANLSGWQNTFIALTQGVTLGWNWRTPSA
ncbi:MAG: hypothetical protein JWM21_4943 [Acidobacteria bacterium]|nr:hypothetical protein [Acidobacteriota bacterium]